MKQNLASFTLPKGFRGRNPMIVQLWWLTQSTLFSWSPQFMYKWRAMLLRAFGAKVGANVIVRPSAKITYPWKVKIGANSWIGDDVVLYSLGDITIGNNVVVSQRGYLCTGSHDYTSSKFDIFAEPIVIENGAWLATDVFVAPGITVSEGAVVGARSSVFNDLKSGTVYAGSPARAIKDRKITR